MGKGSKPRPVGKDYGPNYCRIFGHQPASWDLSVCRNCLEQSFREHMLKPNDDPRTDHPNND